MDLYECVNCGTDYDTQEEADDCAVSDAERCGLVLLPDGTYIPAEDVPLDDDEEEEEYVIDED